MKDGWKQVYCLDCNAKVGERIDIDYEDGVKCPYKNINGNCKYN